MKFFGYNAEDLTSNRPMTLREATILTESIEEIDSLIEFLQFVKHEHLKVNRERENMSVHTHYRDWTEAFRPKGDLIIITETKKQEEKCPADETVEFTDKINSDEYHELSDPEKMAVLLDYFDRFDDNEHIAVQVAQEIFYKLNLSDERKKPHLLKACKRILGYSGDPVNRHHARLMMAVICDEEELEELFKYCLPKEYNEAMEHRFFCKNEKEQAMIFHYATSVEIVHNFMHHGLNNRLDRKYRIALSKENIKFLEYLGNGSIPSAWMSKYASALLSLACLETKEQNYDIAIEYLNKYVDITEKELCTVKDGDILEYGNVTYFGNLTRKAVLEKREDGLIYMCSELQGAKKVRRYLPEGSIFNPEFFLYEFTEYRDLFALRGDERFEALKARAIKLTEEWIKANS